MKIDPPGETTSMSACATACGPPSTPPKLLNDECATRRSPAFTPIAPTVSTIWRRVSDISATDGCQKPQQRNDHYTNARRQQKSTPMDKPRMIQFQFIRLHAPRIHNVHAGID